MKLVEAFDNNYEKLVDAITFKGNKIILIRNERVGK